MLMQKKDTLLFNSKRVKEREKMRKVRKSQGHFKKRKISHHHTVLPLLLLRRVRGPVCLIFSAVWSSLSTFSDPRAVWLGCSRTSRALTEGCRSGAGVPQFTPHSGQGCSIGGFSPGGVWCRLQEPSGCLWAGSGDGGKDKGQGFFHVLHQFRLPFSESQGRLLTAHPTEFSGVQEGLW